MMHTRCMVVAWAGSLLLAGTLYGQEPLPTGNARPAIQFRHFPSRLHAFVWRNWEMVSLERMARVLGTTPARVREIGQSMGLPAHETPAAEYLQRGYITMIRRNWHLLPYEQLLTLLGWDARKLAFTLKEDDFLWIKLGSFKPSCPPLHFDEPNEAVTKRCEEIKAIVTSQSAAEFAKPERPRFGFFGDAIGTPTTPIAGSNKQVRFLYSYCGLFGDPLLSPELDPYPGELLQRLSALGVNGVWLHVVLHQLAPGSVFAELGADHERRIANLRRLVDRAAEYGIDIYLYMNEPRAMPASFFKGREDIRGVRESDFVALCTSAPQVRQGLTESLTYVFKEVPGLGGVFTITASENLTNCYSHSRTPGCPRCSKRSAAEVIAEVNRTIAAGVWAGNPQAKVIVWDWGWPDEAEQIINELPDNVCLMSVSEWDQPITRGGVTSRVGEYSLSAVGPGPRATRHWAMAKQRGLKTIAKVQVNCSWELSAVPYLPVMNLIAQHCSNLARADVDGLMLSWSVGGYPSPNLQLASEFQSQPVPTADEVLSKVAQGRYGLDAAPNVLAAWSKFSTTFTEYPFHAGFIYNGPMQCGPANLLYPEPTGYKATMVGFPYDDVDGWRAVYPADVLAGQLEKIAAGWREGLAAFQKAADKPIPRSQRANLHEDLGLAEAAGLHFRSAGNQIRFTLARNALLSGSLKDEEHEAQINAIKKIVADEIDAASRLCTLTRQDPRIGYEASNHYYYLPLDLVEKVINCRYVADIWLPRLSTQRGQ
ncbi:MAG: hypothetical protein JW955_06815 [Sedimentisphaerales bacterium]|nr:hypothetical protein [Sedimentisphaerales bacterium]